MQIMPMQVPVDIHWRRRRPQHSRCVGSADWCARVGAVIGVVIGVVIGAVIGAVIGVVIGVVIVAVSWRGRVGALVLVRSYWCGQLEPRNQTVIVQSTVDRVKGLEMDRR